MESPKIQPREMEEEKMKLKENKSMGFGMVLAGFILLFNPMIHVIDLIPDVIGFLLIAVGLTKTSFFVSRIDDARRLFWKLVIIEGIKLPSFLMIPYGSMVPHQRGSTQSISDNRCPAAYIRNNNPRIH